MTSAPSRCNHMDSHAPLNPVWPVKKTRLPRQNCGLGIIRRAKARPPCAPDLLVGDPSCETVVPVGHHLSIPRQSLQRLVPPRRCITFNIAEHVGRQISTVLPCIAIGNAEAREGGSTAVSP